MNSTPATARQIEYATKLQADITERLAWTFDRAAERRSFLADYDPALSARIGEAQAAGRTDEARALRVQMREKRDQETEAAMDAHLARREELARTDITTMDREQISAYIDDAKNVLYR